MNLFVKYLIFFNLCFLALVAIILAVFEQDMSVSSNILVKKNVYLYSRILLSE